jgi:hypothetical protein
MYPQQRTFLPIHNLQHTLHQPTWIICFTSGSASVVSPHWMLSSVTCSGSRCICFSDSDTRQREMSTDTTFTSNSWPAPAAAAAAVAVAWHQDANCA